jgi:hypothetical protein
MMLVAAIARKTGAMDFLLAGLPAPLPPVVAAEEVGVVASALAVKAAEQEGHLTLE